MRCTTTPTPQKFRPGANHLAGGGDLVHWITKKQPKNSESLHRMREIAIFLGRFVPPPDNQGASRFSVFWRGFRIGCYTYHDGPNDDDPNPNSPAVVTDDSLEIVLGQPESLTLVADDPDRDPLTLRIVSQPHHGTVGLVGDVATYYPFSGQGSPDSFTFAAWDGQTDSNLGAITVNFNNVIFADGFESGDTSIWSSSSP